MGGAWDWTAGARPERVSRPYRVSRQEGVSRVGLLLELAFHQGFHFLFLRGRVLGHGLEEAAIAAENEYGGEAFEAEQLGHGILRVPQDLVVHLQLAGEL